MYKRRETRRRNWKVLMIMNNLNKERNWKKLEEEWKR